MQATKGSLVTPDELDYKNEPNRFLGQFFFTVVAFSNAAIPALAIYKYRSASDYYSNGDILTGGNWWSRGNKTMMYGRMILFGLTFCM